MALKEGEWVIFTDNRATFLERLVPGARLHTHWGYIEHDKVIGCEPGTRVETSAGKKLYVFYPTLSDFIMNMKRKSGIIYPKDASIILLWADIFPGAQVLVGGVGSGALLLTVLRQVGPAGRVVGYDVRQDMLDCAEENVKSYFGYIPPSLELRLGDIYEITVEPGFDRVLLDVSEPWRALETSYQALIPGGIISCYLPSITQVHTFVTALQESNLFALEETIEVMLRTWYIEGRAVRPEHRMVGHTGFLVFARRVERLR